MSDTVARMHGWPVLLDLIDAYDPQSRADIPIGSAPLANAVARSMIRTRLTDVWNPDESLRERLSGAEVRNVVEGRKA